MQNNIKTGNTFLMGLLKQILFFIKKHVHQKSIKLFTIKFHKINLYLTKQNFKCRFKIYLYAYNIGAGQTWICQHPRQSINWSFIHCLVQMRKRLFQVSRAKSRLQNHTRLAEWIHKAVQVRWKVQCQAECSEVFVQIWVER